jgi:hypothetical protein
MILKELTQVRIKQNHLKVCNISLDHPGVGGACVHVLSVDISIHPAHSLLSTKGISNSQPLGGYYDTGHTGIFLVRCGLG